MQIIFITILSIFYTLFSMVYTPPSYLPSSEETVMPTGYPDGTLQKEYIFWNGKLYTYDTIFVKDLPEDVYKVGEITKEDTINYPDEDLEASHVNIGVAVYAEKSGQYLYVKTSATGYERFSISNDANSSEETVE